MEFIQSQTDHETYLHGYSYNEQLRLIEQGTFLSPQVYKGVDFSTCEHCIEVGSGTGAQTKILLEKFPELKITCIERERAQIEFAQSHLPLNRVNWLNDDAHKLSFTHETFDCAFLCWVLEHVKNPLKVMQEIYRVLTPGSPVCINEVLNKMLYVYPHSPAVEVYWRAFNTLQEEKNGHPYIGALVPSILTQCNFKRIESNHQLLWADARDPFYKSALVTYFQDLILSGSTLLLQESKITQTVVDEAKRELELIKNSTEGVIHFGWCQVFAYK